MLCLRLWVIFHPHSYVALSSRKLCGDAKLRGHIKAGNPTPLSNHVQDSVRLCIGPDLFLSPLPLAKHSHSPPPTLPRSSTPGTKITQFRLSNINFLWCKMDRKCQQAFTFCHSSAVDAFEPGVLRLEAAVFVFHEGELVLQNVRIADLSSDVRVWRHRR